MDPETLVEPKAKAQELATKVFQASTDFFEKGGYKELKQQVSAVVATIESLKDFDHKAFRETLDSLKAKSDLHERQIRASRSVGHVPGIEDEKFRISGLAKGIKTGDWSGFGKEQELVKATTKAAQQAGVDVMGGYFVPDTIIPEVIQPIYRRSAFIALDGAEGETRISVNSNVSGGNVAMPVFAGGATANWVGEAEEIQKTSVAVGTKSLEPRKLGCAIPITEEMLAGEAYGFSGLLNNDIVRAVVKRLDRDIAYGKGGKGITGIMQTPGVRVYSAQAKKAGSIGDDLGATFQTDWQGAELDYDGLDDMKLALEEDDVELEGSLISCGRYFKRLRKLKVTSFSGQTAGQAYLLGSPMVSDAKLRELIGDFGATNQITNVAKPGASIGAPTTSAVLKFGDLIYGDLKDVVLGRWGGGSVVSDGGRGIGHLSEIHWLRFTMRVGLMIRQPRRLLVCPDIRMRD